MSLLLLLAPLATRILPWYSKKLEDGSPNGEGGKYIVKVSWVAVAFLV